jgi:hypothetical protein
MAKFKFSPNDTLTPEAFYSVFAPPAAAKGAAELESFNTKGGAVARGSQSIPDELKNQFVVFQVQNTESGQTIAEASTVEPQNLGSPELPDMYMSVEMQSFHLAKSEQVDRNTRATMRLIIGKDKNSRNRMLDDVFWTISAGLDFYNRLKDEPAKPEEYKTDFSKADWPA